MVSENWKNICNMPQNETPNPTVKINGQEVPLEDLEVDTQDFLDLLDKASEN